MPMTSTATMVERLKGCLGTNDLSAWETEFVENMVWRAAASQLTQLTDKQVETLERLHNKHFAA